MEYRIRPALTAGYGWAVYTLAGELVGECSETYPVELLAFAAARDWVTTEYQAAVQADPGRSPWPEEIRAA